jgi:hypothetical protein
VTADAANGWKPTTERMMYWRVLLNTPEKAASYNQAVYKGPRSALTGTDVQSAQPIPGT